MRQMSSKVSHYSDSVMLFRCLNSRLWRSLRRSHRKRDLVSTRKQVAHKLSGTTPTVPGPKRPLFRLDYSHSNRQHDSCCLYKQGGVHEVAPLLCPIVAKYDLVFQKTGHSQDLTHSRPAECGGGQAVQTGPDPSRGLLVDMYQVAPTSIQPLCNEVLQQISSVFFCVPSSRLLSLGSRFTQSTLGNTWAHIPSH